MSRTFRRCVNPYVCCVGEGEMSEWKTAQSRKLRRKEHQLLEVEDYDSIETLSRDSLWNSPGDGKARGRLEESGGHKILSDGCSSRFG